MDAEESQWLFAAHAGVGVKYYINDFLIGTDFRYQWTAKKGVDEPDNMRLLFKTGYRF